MTAISPLLTPQAQQLLASMEPLSEKADVLSAVTKLRSAGHEPKLVAEVITQLRLRYRARAKFGEFADQMLFTEAGLEQASRLAVAAHHAQRFREAGVQSITDLGCGIGADALAFASLGLAVTAVDLDPETAALASYNLASFPNAEVKVSDAELFAPTTEALWFDPARRDLKQKSASRVMLGPKDFSPNLDFVFESARTKPTGVKLGPAFPVELIPEDCEAQWVSHNGDLVELTLWFGSLARGRRTALALGTASHEFSADQIELAPVGHLGEYVYEPDAALIRSGLMGNLAKLLELRGFAPGIAYLTSDQELKNPWLKSYRLLEVLPLDEKRLAAWCRQHGIGVVEIKKRGVDITPEQLRPKLKLKGTGAATLILTKVGDARKALICEPIR